MNKNESIRRKKFQLRVENNSTRFQCEALMVSQPMSIGHSLIKRKGTTTGVRENKEEKDDLKGREESLKRASALECLVFNEVRVRLFAESEGWRFVITVEQRTMSQLGKILRLLSSVENPGEVMTTN